MSVARHSYALTEGHTCPTCGAKKSQPCRSKIGNRLPEPHIERYRIGVRAFLAARPKGDQ